MCAQFAVTLISVYFFVNFKMNWWVSEASSLGNTCRNGQNWTLGTGETIESAN